MKNYLGFLVCILVLKCGTSTKVASDKGGGNDTTFVLFSNSNIQYEGRVGLNKMEAAELYWSGTTVRISFEGTGIKALLKDLTGQNYYNIIIDGDSIHKIKIDTTKHLYTLAQNLPHRKHTIELFKRTQIHKEYNRGYTKFYGFELDKGSRVLKPPALKKRKIEFYGNSVTCGHAIEDTTAGDSGASIYENNYLSYAALTARHYNAQYSCISKSGIGLMVSFGSLIMPEMYKMLNPFDSTSLWDFAKYTPDIVLVNLCQNDAGIVKRPEYEHFKKRFGTLPPTEEFIIKSYADFLVTIRTRYPNTNIICALGSMNTTQDGSPWPGYVEKALTRMNDKKIFTHFFQYKNTPGHPRVKDNKIMAESLIKFIDTNIKW